MKHTPGPWFVKGCEKAPRDIHIHGQFWQTRIATTSGLCQDAIDKANADLIAAAPELLEALELATHELNAIRARDGHPVSYQFGPNGPIRIDLCTDEWWDELTEKCFATIAKATAS